MISPHPTPNARGLLLDTVQGRGWHRRGLLHLTPAVVTMTTDTLPALSPQASPSPTALAVTRTYFENHQGSQAEEIVFSHADGFRIGGIVDGDRLLIDQVPVADRGDEHVDLGVATISRAVRYADDNGLRLYFDCCTASIRPVLSQLKQAGFVVQPNPGWSLSGSDEPAVEMRSAPGVARQGH